MSDKPQKRKRPHKRSFQVLLFRCRFFDLGFQFLPWTESDNTTGCDRNIFTRFRVTARTLILVPQIKVSETG